MQCPNQKYFIVLKVNILPVTSRGLRPLNEITTLIVGLLTILGEKKSKVIEHKQTSFTVTIYTKRTDLQQLKIYLFTTMTNGEK